MFLPDYQNIFVVPPITLTHAKRIRVRPRRQRREFAIWGCRRKQPLCGLQSIFPDSMEA